MQQLSHAQLSVIAIDHFHSLAHAKNMSVIEQSEFLTEVKEK